MEKSFTWIPLYSEIAKLLSSWEARQDELIKFLESLRSSGLKITPLNDQDADGARFLIKEIDPFTFLGTFNRGVRDSERLAILKRVKEFLGATSPLPEDFTGIPILNNQRSWFVAYFLRREKEDVRLLWRVFTLALQANPLESSEFGKAFDDALGVRGVAVNLTMGLFWIRPEVFLNLDSTNREYLELKLPADGLSFGYYKKLLSELSANSKSFPEISRDAYHGGIKPTPPKGCDHWLVGAYWNDTDPPDQTERFLFEGIWQNGYSDKYFDVVRSVKVGDRIAIKSTSTQKNHLPFDGRGKTVSKMTIKAIGTVVANRGDGRTLEVEWQPDYEPKNWFFSANWLTICKLSNEPGQKESEVDTRLIDFVWNGQSQDYDWFIKYFLDKNPSPNPDAYGIEDIVSSGVFLSEDEIRQALERLDSKKNLILQGAPGVGKSFVARKLAYALMKEKANDRIEMVQFHQTYAYEDFIRGYRPLPDQAGTFGLQDAVFYRFCKRAQEDPDRVFVFIIDEINRGNLSQIFGELLMLIEADKRGPEFAVPLVYQLIDEARFFVPPNVHIIGLMNLADRSLAIVDYALRRRFAFLTLKAQYGSSSYRDWLLDRQMKPELVDLLNSRMKSLNQLIAEDPLLGENYQIGHSFFCPKGENFSGLDRSWYEGIVQTEIVPLLKEYWFDNSKKVEQAQSALLAK